MSADIIARCTRDGRVQWQQVSIQMGVSVDSARSQFDQAYKQTHERAPDRMTKPKPKPKGRPKAAATNSEPVPRRRQDPDHKSPHTRRNTLSKRLLIALLKRPDSSVILAAAVNTTAMSARVTLNKLRADGLVTDDGRKPMTWRLTTTGMEVARAIKASQNQIGRITKTEVDQ